MKQVICLLLALLIVSCKTDDSTLDCSAVLCLAFSLNIKIIDTETNSNYIIENNITENDIEVKNTQNESIDFYLVSQSTSSFNGAIGIYVYASNIQTISINNLNDIVVSYTVIPPQTNGCCDFGSIENLMVENYQFEFNSETKRLIVYL